MLGLSEQNYVVCPKCNALNPLTANYCANCGLQLQSRPPLYPPSTQARVVGGAFSKENLLQAFSTRRVKLMIIGFIIELALFLAFSALPMSQAQYQAIVNSPSYKQINMVRAEGLISRAVSIFQNNYFLASLEMVPALGPAIFTYTTYSTARVLDALGYGSGVPGPLLFVNIMLFPHSWLELPAYAISATQSVILVYSWVKKRFFQELARTIIVWLFVGLELFVAAVIESSIITLESYGILQPLLMWIPTLVIFYIAYTLLKRLNKPQNPLSYQSANTAV